jgi:hypothetical protein
MAERVIPLIDQRLAKRQPFFSPAAADAHLEVQIKIDPF